MAMALSVAQEAAARFVEQRGPGDGGLYKPKQDITILIEKPRLSGPSRTADVERLQVLPNSTIKDIKLQLRARQGASWSAFNRQTLVYGGRELHDHEVVGRLAAGQAENAPDHLHVLLNCSDLNFAQLGLSSSQPTSPVQSPLARTRSALTAEVAASPRLERRRGRPSLCIADEAAEDAAPLQAAVDGLSDGILHLLIKRSAHMALKQLPDCFELAVSARDTAAAVTTRIEVQSGLPHHSHQLLCNGFALPASRPLSGLGLQKGCVLELVPLSEFTGHGSPATSTSPPLDSPAHGLYEGWRAAQAGLAKGISPSLASSGTGGSYLLRSASTDAHAVAVFKPKDEEPLAINNPKPCLCGESNGDSCKVGILPGEGAEREVIAYILDHEHLAGVPATAMVACQEQGQALGGNVKVGSLQKFVDSDGDCEEWGASQFPVQEVHRIAILDMRLANTDRNGSNILVRRQNGQCHLTPIDHGMILPASVEDLSFEWLFWPQAKKPFSPELLRYISQLDADRDLQLIADQRITLRPDCERIFRATTMVLKKGAALGLTPFQIGLFMSRRVCDASPLEGILEEALAQAATQIRHQQHNFKNLCLRHSLSEQVVMQLVESLVDERLEQHGRETAT